MGLINNLFAPVKLVGSTFAIATSFVEAIPTAKECSEVIGQWFEDEEIAKVKRKADRIIAVAEQAKRLSETLGCTPQEAMEYLTKKDAQEGL